MPEESWAKSLFRRQLPFPDPRGSPRGERTTADRSGSKRCASRARSSRARVAGQWSSRSKLQAFFREIVVAAASPGFRLPSLRRQTRHESKLLGAIEEFSRNPAGLPTLVDIFETERDSKEM